MADVYDTLGGFVADQMKSSFKGTMKGIGSAFSSGKKDDDTEKSEKQTVQRIKQTESLVSSIKTNFNFLSSIARDITGVSNRVASIVEVMGDKPATIDALSGITDTTPTSIKEPDKPKKPKGFLGSIVDFLKTMSEIIFKAGFLGIVIATFWDDIKKSIGEAFAKFSFTEAFKGIFKFFYELLGIDVLVEQLTEAKDKFMGKIDEFASKVAEKYESFKKKYLEPFKNFAKSLLKKGFDKLPERLKPFVVPSIRNFIGIPLSDEQKKDLQEKKDQKLKDDIRKRLTEEGKIIELELDTSFFAARGTRGKTAKIQDKLKRDANERLIKLNEQLVDEEFQKVKKQQNEPSQNQSSKEIEEVVTSDYATGSTSPVAVPESGDKTVKSKGLSGDGGASDESPTKVSGDDDIKAMIIGHEDVRYQPYKDSKGLYTVGVGHLIGTSLPKHMDRTFSPTEVNNLFESDYAKHKKIAERTPGYDKANKAGKAALIDLAFNMGAWYKEFKKAAAALKEGDFVTASKELEDSDWYNQVGSRGPTIVSLIASAGDNSGGSDLSSASAVIAKGKRLQTAAAGEENQKIKVVTNNNNSVLEKETIVRDDSSDYGQLASGQV